MGGNTRVLCFILFLSVVIGKGSSRFDPSCPPETIKVDQMPTGKVIGCTKEWKVNITNLCSCNPFQVHLKCPSFDKVVLTNDNHYTITEIGKSSGDCVLNKGQPLGFPRSYVNVFTYIGDRIDFAVSAYSAACSKS